MPRAMAELGHAVPDVELVPYPVVSDKLRAESWWQNPATVKLLLSEYVKYTVVKIRTRFEPASNRVAPCAAPEPDRQSCRRFNSLCRSVSTCSTCALFSSTLLSTLTTLAFCVGGLWAFLLPTTKGARWVARTWGASSIWLLRVIAGTRLEVRGGEKIPPGGIIVASKHQSAFETFGLLPVFPDFTIILKRELMWLPMFGWYLWKAGMVPIDRGARGQVMARMTERAREALADGRQIVIFPEGTRMPPGAPPAYKFGVAALYADTGAPCVPVALNSGVYWPRRKFLRYPGTIVFEILDPILPGLSRREFFERLQNDLETATTRLIAQSDVRERRDA